MKSNKILFILTLTASLFIVACNSKSKTEVTMQQPIEKDNQTAAEKVGSEPAVDKVKAKEKTIENMQAAFKGETNASARYAAFSKKAKEEGFQEIAMLFKAASISENIHAGNHKVVLEEMGVATNPVTLDVVVKSTKENLEAAISGETYEVAEMYPTFLTDAKNADNQLALISLNYAYKTEQKRKVFYENALTALNNKTTAQLPLVYFVCPTCGNTYDIKAPKRCGISMTNGDKFIKINSL